MNLMKKTTLFCRETIARLKGDTDKAMALRNYQMVDAGIDGQIAGLTQRKIEQQGRIIDAEEALISAKFPTDKITNLPSYFEKVKSAENNLNALKEDFESIEESILYYRKLKQEFAEEVDSPKVEDKK